MTFTCIDNEYQTGFSVQDGVIIGIFLVLLTALNYALVDSNGFQINIQ